jgi:hypothetical protein
MLLLGAIIRPANQKQMVSFYCALLETSVSCINVQVPNPYFTLFEGYTSSKVQSTGHFTADYEPALIRLEWIVALV